MTATLQRFVVVVNNYSLLEAYNSRLYGVVMGTFGDRTKEAREEAGLSQTALAKQLHVTQQAISKIEANRAKGTYLVAQLSDTLRVNADWLLKGVGPKRPGTGDPELDQIAEEQPATFMAANRLFDLLLDLSEDEIRAIENLVSVFAQRGPQKPA